MQSVSELLVADFFVEDFVSVTLALLLFVGAAADVTLVTFVTLTSSRGAFEALDDVVVVVVVVTTL